MSNLVARFATAAVVVPFLIIAINWQNPIGAELIIFTAAAIGLREWTSMTLPGAKVADRAVGVFVGTALVVVTQLLGERPLVVPLAGATATILTLLWFLLRPGPIEKVATHLAFTLAGYAYVGLLVFLSLLKLLPDGAAWMFVALTVGWIGDTGAYFAGRFLGARFPLPLYPLVSPKKTVIGFFGGIFGSYLAVVLAKLWYLPSLTWLDTVLIAVPANLLGQAGDLAESLVKRSVGVKDSGNLLPGHGGMLDRIDAVLFVSPYVWAYARFVVGAR